MEENTIQTNETNNVDELLQLFGFTNEDFSLLNNNVVEDTPNIIETNDTSEVVKEKEILTEIPQNSDTLLIKESTSRFLI